MKRIMIGLLAGGAVLFVVPEAMARPHHHRDNDGLRLAAGIVNLVKTVVTPVPTKVVQRLLYDRSNYFTFSLAVRQEAINNLRMFPQSFSVY